MSIIVEPPYIKGSRDWQNLFAIPRFLYIEVLLHAFYYHWGQENRCYTADFVIQRFVISRFHCNLNQFMVFGYISLPHLLVLLSIVKYCYFKNRFLENKLY